MVSSHRLQIKQITIFVIIFLFIQAVPVISQVEHQPVYDQFQDIPLQQGQQQQVPIQQQQQVPIQQQVPVQQQQQVPVQQQQQVPIQQQQQVPIQQQQQVPVQQQQQVPIQQQQQVPIQQQVPVQQQVPIQQQQRQVPSQQHQEVPVQQQRKVTRKNTDPDPDDINDVPESSPYVEMNDYFFRMLVKPKVFDCAYHMPKDDFEVRFQPVEGSKLVASVFDPTGKEVFDEEVEGLVTHHTDVPKELSGQPYKICFENRDKWATATISVEIGDPLKREINKNTTHSLRKMITDLRQELGRYESLNLLHKALKAKHLKRMETNLGYVTYFSLAHTALMIIGALLQVVLVRSLFDEKSVLHRFLSGKRSNV